MMDSNDSLLRIVKSEQPKFKVPADLVDGEGPAVFKGVAKTLDWLMPNPIVLMKDF